MRALLPLLTLCACAQVVPETALRLAQLDPLTADPGQISVAVQLPPGLDVLPLGASLEIAASSGKESLHEKLVLQPQMLAQMLAQTPAKIPKAKTGKTLIFALLPADAEKMRGWQADVAAWKASGQKGAGSLGLSLEGCRQGPGPAPGAIGAAYVRFSTDEPFLPLIPPVELEKLLGPEALSNLAPCAGPQ